jgi:general secretion pathway protein K
VKRHSTLSTQHSALSNERGVALIVVLWIFIFLFVVAFDFSAAVREEGMAAHRYAEEAEGYYLALAGFQQGIYELMKLSAKTGQVTAPQGSDVFEGDWIKGNLGGGVYEVRFVDESGKININRINDDTLRLVLAHLGVEEKRRNIIVDSVMDWRDEDDLHRLNGAESDYYLTLSPPYTARNGPFDSVEDLLWVRGVTPDIFYGREGGVGLQEVFTVDSPAGVNLRTATPAVCVALLGVPLEKCQAFIDQRAKLSEKTLADLLRLLGIADDDLIRRQVMFANPTVITIEAKGHQANSTSERQVKGVVRMLGGDRGYDLLRWIDRDSPKGIRSTGFQYEEGDSQPAS